VPIPATSARSGSIRCDADLLLARLSIVSFARIVLAGCGRCCSSLQRTEQHTPRIAYPRYLLFIHGLSLLLPSAAAAAALKAATRAGDKVAVPLNNNDAIFAEIRDLSIERLGGYLQEKAIHIRERCAALLYCA
jgi:hypothetical protein